MNISFLDFWGGFIPNNNFFYYLFLSIDNKVQITRPEVADVIIFSRESHGHKISGWGHDGTKEARKELMKQLIVLLHREGFWIEVSGRPADILIGAGCKYCDKQTVSKIFLHSEINWIRQGVYTRTLPDHTITEEEYLIGRPIV